MTTPSVNQVFKVTGELQVIPSSTYADSKGVISFMGNFGTKLGQLRTYGYGAYQSLLLDGSECYGGLQFRSSINQGGSDIGGLSDQMTMEMSNSGTTTVRRLVAKETSNAYQQNFGGAPNLTVGRSNTSQTSVLTNDVAQFSQDNWKVGESMQISHGMNAYGGCSVWGYTANSTSSSDALNTSYIGMTRSGTTKKNINLKTTGDVEMPFRLDVGTVSATTYLNLPPVPSSELLPLTLDKTNNRVGINTTTPTVDLDVNGTTTTSYLTLSSIPSSLKTEVLMYDTTTKSVSYAPVSSVPPNVLPITLDKTNNRVGINIPIPEEALDVDGNIQGTGDLIIDGNIYLQGLQSNPTSQSLFYDPTTKLVSYGPVPSSPGSNQIVKTVNTTAYSSPVFTGTTELLRITPGINGYIRIGATCKITTKVNNQLNLIIYRNNMTIENVIRLEGYPAPGTGNVTKYYYVDLVDIKTSTNDIYTVGLSASATSSQTAGAFTADVGDIIFSYQQI